MRVKGKSGDQTACRWKGRRKGQSPREIREAGASAKGIRVSEEAHERGT